MRLQNAQQRVKSFAEATNAPRTVERVMNEEIAAYVRSGALDTMECEALAIEAFARRFRLTMRQAEAYWTSTTAPAGTFA